jgi:hypothetical protein
MVDNRMDAMPENDGRLHFIVGFDNDTPSIFQRQIDFIRKSGTGEAVLKLKS